MSRVGKTGRIGAVVALGVLIAVPASRAEDAAAPAQEATRLAIHDNMEVQLEYKLTSDGKVIDATEGREPFKYVHGRGQIIPGLEKQLAGMHAGESKQITVTPEEGYGPVDPKAFVEVPKEQLPQNVKLEVGMGLGGADPDGRPFRATIHELKDKTAVLDLNHPLAGKTLQFDVRVVNIAPASSE